MTNPESNATTATQSLTSHHHSVFRKESKILYKKAHALTFSLGTIGVFHRKFQLLYELTAIHTSFLPDVKQSFQGLFAALICFSAQRSENNYSSAEKHMEHFKRASSKLAPASMAMLTHLERFSLSKTDSVKHICDQFFPFCWNHRLPESTPHSHPMYGQEQLSRKEPNISLNFQEQLVIKHLQVDMLTIQCWLQTVVSVNNIPIKKQVVWLIRHSHILI